MSNFSDDIYDFHNVFAPLSDKSDNLDIFNEPINPYSTSQVRDRRDFPSVPPDPVVNLTNSIDPSLFLFTIYVVAVLLS
jgi:hypothetical protein